MFPDRTHVFGYLEPVFIAEPVKHERFNSSLEPAVPYNLYLNTEFLEGLPVECHLGSQSLEVEHRRRVDPDFVCCSGDEIALLHEHIVGI